MTGFGAFSRRVEGDGNRVQPLAHGVGRPRAGGEPAVAGGGGGRHHRSYAPATGLLVSGDAAGEGLGVNLRADRLDVFPFPSATSPAAVLAPGSGCQAQAPGLTCAFAGADNRAVTANLGDGADLFIVLGTALPSPPDAVVDGGAGNDDLRGGPGPDLIDGGPDADVLRGGRRSGQTTCSRAATGTTSWSGTSAASTGSGARATTTSFAR